MVLLFYNLSMNIIIDLILDYLETKGMKEITSKFLKFAKALRMSPEQLVLHALKKPQLLKQILQKAATYNPEAFLEFKKVINTVKLPGKYYRKVKQFTSPTYYRGKVIDLIKWERTEKRNRKSPYDFSMLSSSWLISGAYNAGYGENRGILTLDFVNAKHSYTYFNIPREVWEAMKAAKGRNGNGAGSVFWNMYLRRGGSWLSYDAIEYNAAYKLTQRTETPLESLKTYQKLITKYTYKQKRIGKNRKTFTYMKPRMTWKGQGIHTTKALAITKKHIYKQRQGIMIYYMKNNRKKR